MRWTLADVRAMDAHECHELVQWLHEVNTADKDGAIDMDAVTDAKLAGMETPEDSDGDW